MKLWSLSPEYLDSGRLLQEHRSIHGILHAISGKADIKIRRYYNYGGYLVFRHYALVEEMRIRNHDHRSYVDKLFKALPERRRRLDFKISKREIEDDVHVLLGRQQRANKSKEEGRVRVYNSCPTEWLERIEKIQITGLPKDIFLI